MPSLVDQRPKALASISEVGLMRKIQGLPDVVILPEDEVSTSIGTLYSSSFGMTASVRVELQAPIITGTLSLHDQLLGRAHGLGRVGFVVLDDRARSSCRARRPLALISSSAISAPCAT